MSQATADRRKQIMSQLLEQKQVTVKELAAEMEVSDATVRRDLKALADEQGLKLVHGGAALPRERDFSFQARLLRSQRTRRKSSARSPASCSATATTCSSIRARPARNSCRT